MGSSHSHDERAGAIEPGVVIYMPNNQRDVVHAEEAIVRQEPAEMPVQPMAPIALPANGRPEA